MHCNRARTGVLLQLWVVDVAVRHLGTDDVRVICEQDRLSEVHFLFGDAAAPISASSSSSSAAATTAAEGGVYDVYHFQHTLQHTKRKPHR